MTTVILYVALTLFCFAPIVATLALIGLDPSNVRKPKPIRYDAADDEQRFADLVAERVAERMSPYASETIGHPDRARAERDARDVAEGADVALAAVAL